MKTVTRIIQLSVLVVATFSMSAAMACTTGAWNGGVTGDPAPLDDTPATALPRVSGKCAMTLTAAGSVKDVSPAAEPQVFIRFYVLADLNSGSPTIFQAFSDDAATAELITINFDGSNFVFDAGVTASDNVAGKPGWNMIELAWVGGSTMDYWVNTESSEAATGQVNAKAGTMESVILGSVAGPDGKLIFDDYESHRETAIGGLLIGDTNKDGDVNVFDISATLLEVDFFNPAIQEGTPDCNMDGEVNVFDISATVLAVDFFNPIPCNSN